MSGSKKPYWTPDRQASILFLILGIPLFVFGISRCFTKISSSDWERTEASVVSFNSFKVNTKRTVWCPDIDYSYEIGGVKYKGDRNSVVLISDIGCFNSEAKAEKWASEVRLVKKLNIFYNPRDPRQSSIFRERWDALDFVSFFGGMAFVICGLVYIRKKSP